MASQPPDTVNLIMQTGEDFSFRFNVNQDGSAWNLTGLTANMSLRLTYDAVSSIDDYASAAEITLGNGTLDIDVTDTVIGGYSFSECVYDIIITDGGGIRYVIVKGKITLLPVATQL